MSEKRLTLNNATVLDVINGKLLPNHRVVIGRIHNLGGET